MPGNRTEAFLGVSSREQPHMQIPALPNNCAYCSLNPPPPIILQSAPNFLPAVSASGCSSCFHCPVPEAWGPLRNWVVALQGLLDSDLLPPPVSLILQVLLEPGCVLRLLGMPFSTHIHALLYHLLFSHGMGLKGASVTLPPPPALPKHSPPERVARGGAVPKVTPGDCLGEVLQEAFLPVPPASAHFCSGAVGSIRFIGRSERVGSQRSQGQGQGQGPGQPPPAHSHILSPANEATSRWHQVPGAAVSPGHPPPQPLHPTTQAPTPPPLWGCSALPLFACGGCKGLSAHQSLTLPVHWAVPFCVPFEAQLCFGCSLLWSPLNTPAQGA